MTIKKGYTVTRKGNRWCVVIDMGPHPITGKRQQKWHSGFATEEAADEAARDLLHSIRHKTYVTPDKGTVAEYLNEWLDGLRLKASTVDSYRRNVRLHIIPNIGHVQLQKLTAAHLDDFYKHLETGGRTDGSGGLKPRTVRYIHTIIQSALRKAKKRKLITENVALDAEPPTPDQVKMTTPEMAVWTEDELDRFLEFTRGDRYRPAWALLSQSGMRRGEALGLRWTAVDFTTGHVNITRSIIPVGHKATESTTKTGKDRRVRLDDNTMELLRKWRARQAEERVLIGPAYHDSGLVLTLPTGHGYHPERFSREFERKQATYNRLHPETPLLRIRLHDLRHTHITILKRKGVPDKVIMERVGHTNISTMMGYTHFGPDDHLGAAGVVASCLPNYSA